MSDCMFSSCTVVVFAGTSCVFPLVASVTTYFASALPERAVAAVHDTIALDPFGAAVTLVAAPFDTIERHGSPRTDPHGGYFAGMPVITGNSAHAQAYIRELLQLAHDFGRPHPDGLRIELRVTHNDLAGAAVGSRANVTRSLEDLRTDGLVLVDDHRLVVTHRGLAGMPTDPPRGWPDRIAVGAH